MKKSKIKTVAILLLRFIGRKRGIEEEIWRITRKKER
jgi:hypothetical protein